MKKVLGSIGVLVAVVHFSATPAGATSIVVNGSFETGDLTGWTDGGNTGWNSVSSGAAAPGGGSFGIDNGAVGSFSTLSQTLTTTVGTPYTINFWFRNDGGGIFNLLFGGNVLYSESGLNHAYQFHTLVSPGAISTSTVLQLQFRDDPGFVQFDNITVEAAVPEPATGLLLVTGLAALARRARSTKRR